MHETAALQRYNHLAMLFHWLIALFILFNLAVGFFMEGWQQPLRARVVGLHASFGMSVLGLALLRVLWRLARRPPELHPSLLRWERQLAQAVHVALYVLMFALPITGWAFLSCHPLSPRSGVHIFDLFTIPPLMPFTALAPPEQKQTHDLLVEVHAAGAWFLIGLLVLHLAGALKHQFIDGQPALARMGLGRMR